jgi:uncharacterized protein (TIGR00106 family)
MAIAEVSIVPIGTADTSVSEYVVSAVQELKKSGLKFRLTPMGTIIEGDIKDVMDVVIRMHETPFNKAVKRVYTTIKIDDRRDKDVEMIDKVKSVEKKLKE